VVLATTVEGSALSELCSPTALISVTVFHALTVRAERNAWSSTGMGNKLIERRQYSAVGFEVLTAVSMKIAVFCLLTSTRLHGATTQKTAILIFCSVWERESYHNNHTCSCWLVTMSALAFPRGHESGL
jgi:hypothetical protein